MAKRTIINCKNCGSPLVAGTVMCPYCNQKSGARKTRSQRKSKEWKTTPTKRLHISITIPVGWIDFSRSERSKILSVLDLLSQRGTLDELGIAPVRDGFADLFFPGTSTIQTRAKYFLLVPYILKDLELDKESNPHQLLKNLDALEMECAKILIKKGEDLERITRCMAMWNSCCACAPIASI